MLRGEITQWLQINDAPLRVRAMGLRASEIVERLARLTMNRQPILRTGNRDRLEILVRGERPLKRCCKPVGGPNRFKPFLGSRRFKAHGGGYCNDYCN